jgi:IPT/TIG domain
VQISGRQLLPGGGSCLLLQELAGVQGGRSLPRCAQVIVYFGGEPGLVFDASPTHIDVFSPPHPSGPADVTVTTTAGTSATQRGDRFTYVGPLPPTGAASPPAVTKVSPTQGPASGFTPVLVRGEGLLPVGANACLECAAVTVRFGARAVAVLEGTQHQLLVASPPHEAGTVDLAVSVDGVISATTAADRFTYLGRGHGHHGHGRRNHRHHRRKHHYHRYKQHSGRAGHSGHGGRGH